MGAGLSSRRSAASLATPNKTSVVTWVRRGETLLVAPPLTARTRRRFACKRCFILQPKILPYIAAGGELRVLGSILRYLAPLRQFVVFEAWLPASI